MLNERPQRDSLEEMKLALSRRKLTVGGVSAAPQPARPRPSAGTDESFRCRLEGCLVGLSFENAQRRGAARNQSSFIATAWLHEIYFPTNALCCPIFQLLLSFGYIGSWTGYRLPYSILQGITCGWVVAQAVKRLSRAPRNQLVGYTKLRYSGDVGAAFKPRHPLL